MCSEKTSSRTNFIGEKLSYILSRQATGCVVKYIFLISHINYTLWVFKSTVLLAPKYMFLTNGVENNLIVRH